MVSRLRQRAIFLGVVSLMLVVFIVFTWRTGFAREKILKTFLPPVEEDEADGAEKSDKKPYPVYKEISAAHPAPPVKDNFPLAHAAHSAADLPPIPRWNRPRSPHVPERT